MNQVKKSVKYVTKRATQKESVNPPVGTVTNQATGIGIALKRRIGAEVKAEERKESHQTQERETNQTKEKVLLTQEIKRIIKVVKTTVCVMIVHQSQSQKMTELPTPDQDPIQNLELKMKPLKKERNQKEETLNLDIIRIIVS